MTGGKLTTYRSMAAEIVDRVQEKLGKKVRAAKTDSVPLPGAKRATEIDRLQRDDRRLAQRLSPERRGLLNARAIRSSRSWMSS